MSARPITLHWLQSRCLSWLLAAALLGAALPSHGEPDEEADSAVPQGLREVKDLRYGDTLYYFFQQRYFSAIVQLASAQKTGKIVNHKDEATLLLGGLYLSFGLHYYASQIFERLIAERAPLHVRNRAWFYIAKIRYQRGLFIQAEHALQNLQGKLSDELEPERLVMQANLLMARQAYPEAVEILRTLETKTDWQPYARYNLGVALVNSGQREAGLKALAEVGALSAQSQEIKALRDQANLSLGYVHIRSKSPERAEPFLRQVRLQGPQANRALLGLGWAYSSQGKHRQALRPWLELRGREILDPAVQEALLASAYGLSQLQADKQALEYYENAISIYSTEITRLSDSIASIRDGRLINMLLEGDIRQETGWFWRMTELPETPESRYLLRLLSSHRFQEAVKSYRDLRFMLANLQRWAEYVEVFHAMLDTRRKAYLERLPKLQAFNHAGKAQRYQQQRDRVAQALDSVENDNNILALANTKERALLQRLERVEQRLARLRPHQDTGAAQEKYRLLQGLLYWKIASDYRPRLWEAQQDLKLLDQALGETRERTESLRFINETAERSFSGYQARIDRSRGTIQNLITQLQEVSQRQGDHIQNLAVAALEDQKRRLGAYITQARLAVAQIHDRASQQEGSQP